MFPFPSSGYQHISGIWNNITDNTNTLECSHFDHLHSFWPVHSLSSNSNNFLNKIWSWTGSHQTQCPGLTWYKSYSAWSFHRGWLNLDNWQALSPIPDTQIPKYQNLGTGAVTIITWATTPVLFIKKPSNDQIANKIDQVDSEIKDMW